MLSPAAHHSAFEETKLHACLEQVEILLLRYLRPSEPEKLRQIERVVNDAGTSPRRQTLAVIEPMLDGFHDRRAFFAAIQSREWLPLLVEEGWFDPDAPNGPKGDHPNAGGPEVELLGRLAEDGNLDDVARGALLLAKLKDEWVQHRLLQLAPKLPEPTQEAFVQRATSWIEASRGSFVLGHALAEFIGPVLRKGITTSVEQLIATALKVHPDAQLEEKAAKHNASEFPFSLISLDPEPILDPDALKKFLSQLTSSAQGGDRLLVLRLLASAISEHTQRSIWQDELETRGGYDGSMFWRPAVEASDQQYHRDQRDTLVTTTRDLAEIIITRQPADFSSVEDVLNNQHWLIFKRIRIHLLRTNPEAAGQTRIRACLFDDKVRNGTDAWHEWALLLREQFKHLSSEDQMAILGWITTEMDLSATIERYREFHQGLSPSAEEVAFWQAERWRRKLAIIKDSLPEEWKAAHPELCEGLDDVEPIEFHYQSLGARWIDGTKSHITAEEVTSTAPSELVRSLSDWKEKDPYEGPSESGLLATLKTAGQQSPAEILQQLDAYNELKASRQVALLEGIWAAANEGADIDCRLLLETTGKMVRDTVIPHDRSRDLRREASLGTSLIRAIETALGKDGLPQQFRREVFKCITAFLEHPDPAPQDEERDFLPEGLSSTSLNTPRPIALRCIFDYGRWLRRSETEDVPEVLQTLERALQNEPTLAGRSVFGEQMNWLLAHHRPWVEAHLSDLFPANSPGKRDAVWNCFITMCGASKAALEVFRPEYERAIEECRTEPAEKPSSDWSPQRGFVRHLCAYYWWGFEPVDQASLTTKFLETATLGLREYVFRYIARSLDETKDDLPDAVAKRFMDLADWRIAALSEATPGSTETQELRGIVGWAESGKLPAKWMLQRLREVLRLLSGSGFEHQMLPFDFLASQVESHPALAIGCMYELTFGPDRMGKKTPAWWGQQDEAKTILRLALASGVPDVVRQAEEVQDHLLRLGRLEYRNLEPEAE